MATVKDPVCSMNIDPDRDAVREEYKGKTYFFCSQACRARFLESPHLYTED